jgi:hypothetical protein
MIQSHSEKFRVEVTGKEAGWNCSVTLSASMEELVGSAHFNPSEINRTKASTLEVTVLRDAEPGYHKISVTAQVSGGASCSLGEALPADIFLEVIGFSVMIFPKNLTVQAGTSEAFEVNVARHGFTGKIMLRIMKHTTNGISLELRCTEHRPQPTSRFECTPCCASELLVRVNSDTPNGTYPVLIDGMTIIFGERITRSGEALLNVVQACAASEVHQSPAWLPEIFPVLIIGLLFGASALVADIRSTVPVRSLVPSPAAPSPPRTQARSPLCPRCRHSNRAGSKFCTRCGETLPRPQE